MASRKHIGTIIGASLAAAAIVAAATGVRPHIPIQNVEWDHFCAIEDSDSPADLNNLRLEPLPDFHPKYVVENALHKDVCSGKLSLREGHQVHGNESMVQHDGLLRLL